MKLPGRKAVFAGILAVLAACGGDPTGVVVAERMELGAARALWDAGNVDDYRMTVRLNGAWFGGSAVIRVRDGVPVSVIPVDSDNGASAEPFRGYDTVEELFAIVENAVQENAFRLDAEYHSRLGLPVDVYVDMRSNVADEEQGFVVEAFIAE